MQRNQLHILSFNTQEDWFGLRCVIKRGRFLFLWWWSREWKRTRQYWVHHIFTVNIMNFYCWRIKCIFVYAEQVISSGLGACSWVKVNKKGHQSKNVYYGVSSLLICLRKIIRMSYSSNFHGSVPNETEVVKLCGFGSLSCYNICTAIFHVKLMSYR